MCVVIEQVHFMRENMFFLLVEMSVWHVDIKPIMYALVIRSKHIIIGSSLAEYRVENRDFLERKGWPI